MKFILFLPAGGVGTHDETLAIWKQISSNYKKTKQAIFAYIIGDTLADVFDYFGVHPDSDIPIIVAQNPAKDQKFRSQSKLPLNYKSMSSFVSGVITGDIVHIFKSEPVPRVQKGNVIKAVGSTVISIVNQTDKDVLLEVYAPWCTHCKALAPTYDILGKAVQGESRIVIAKIDGVANDIPASWGVKSYPTLLWFPAADKPYDRVPVPRPYWDAGHSLHELFSFVVRESSFDAKELKVATTEQLGSLLGEEDSLREKYEKEDRWNKRNENRHTYENIILDYMDGEIIFDGKRWHILCAVMLGMIVLGLGIALAVNISQSMNKSNGVSGSKNNGKKKSID